jgi:hypothetical protein
MEDVFYLLTSKYTRVVPQYYLADKASSIFANFFDYGNGFRHASSMFYFQVKKKYKHCVNTIVKKH